MKCIKYPKIKQFRDVIRDVSFYSSLVGFEENGDPILNESLNKPTLTFKGTVKLHGTNSGIGYSRSDGLWAQSRNNIITPENDNNGFASFVESKKEILINHFNFLEKQGADLDKQTVFYGEWAGSGINNGCGIHQLKEKSFFYFDLFSDEKWIDYEFIHWDGINNLYSIRKFKTFQIDIDFNNPESSQNQLIEITNEVERECPVAKKLGFSGIGEGVVWSCHWEDKYLQFKVKGEKHQVSKVKTLAPVDEEKLNSITEFVNYSVTDNRFNQAISEVIGESIINIEKLGHVIRWVVKDIIDEESETLKNSDLTTKDVSSYIATKVRKKYQDLIQW